MRKNFGEFLAAFEKCSHSEEDFIVITLVDIDGSAPQDIGARCIITQDGLSYGTIGGGKLENHAIQLAKKILSGDGNKENHLAHINLQKDLGMNCGGAVRLFFEPHLKNKKWSIKVFGAGHISQALTRLLLNLDCHVTCIDNRKEWLDKLPEHINLKKVFLENHADFVDKLDNKDFVILMTMGSSTDYPILKKILLSNELDLPYFGMIGSDIKRKNVERDLLKDGVPENKLSKFLCPVGLPIGNNDPNEISFSLIAQLLEYRG